MIEAKVRARLGQFQLAAELNTSGVTCLSGKNGSGKTTLLRAIAGFLHVDDGYVKIGGVDVTRLPVENRGVVMVTPSSCFPHMEVDAHVVWGARLRKMRLSQEDVSRVKSELGIDYGGSVRNLSLGMRERVALATALLASPRAILVDDVFTSLHQREDVIASYSRLVTERSIDLIFTCQDEADGRLATQMYRMDNGSISGPKRPESS
jgi:molybdate/tungstate transport system ATP-binding protein